MKVNVHKSKCVFSDGLFLFILALIPRMIFYFTQLMRGKLPQTDDTAWYLEHARLLTANMHIDVDFNGIFYLSFYGLLALTQLIVKNINILILLQMIINALSVIILYKLCMEFSSRRTAIWSGVIYSFLWPMIYWSIFLITDSLFISLMLIQAYLAVKVIKSKERVHIIWLIIISFYMIFFRPTGVLTLAFTLLYLLMNSNLKPFVKKYRIILTLPFAFLITMGIVAFEVIIHHPLAESIRNNMWWLLVDNYSKGMIYDIPTIYDYKYNAIMPKGLDTNFIGDFFVNNFSNILMLYGKRILAFAGVWVWKIRGGNILIQLKYLVPFLGTIVCFCIGIWRFRCRRDLKIASISIFMIGSIAVFTVFFFMDSAYRYRVPALVFAIIPIAQGIDYLWVMILNLKRKLFIKSV